MTANQSENQDKHDNSVKAFGQCVFRSAFIRASAAKIRLSETAAALPCRFFLAFRFLDAEFIETILQSSERQT